MDPQSRQQDQIDRLAIAVSVLTDNVAKLDAVLLALTESAIITDQRFRETDQRFREMSAETDRRFRETDERIGKLVSAIGQFIPNR